MFSKTIDGKQTVTDDDNNEYVDLTESIFGTSSEFPQTYSVYKVPMDFKMRPDLISCALYGTEEYTEMVMKYSGIINPFSIDEDDIIYSVSLNSIYNPVKNVEYNKNNTFDAVKNYHKYIDKSKVPESDSDKNVFTPTEANISENGETGITVENGRIYFGSTTSDNAFRIAAGLSVDNGHVYLNVDEATSSVIDLKNGMQVETTGDKTKVTDLTTGKVIDVVTPAKDDYPLCDCAQNGVTIGEFLNKTLKSKE